MAPDTSDATGEARGFSTTRWSLILSSLGEEDSEGRAREALAQLCHIYWRPIFAYVCRRGRSLEDAQDLTQDFFLMILKGNLLQHADAERGRFRSLLLKSLQNFLNDAHGKARAVKRGGGVEFVSWDEWMAEAPSRLTLSYTALESSTPEKIFDVRWAATVAERALGQLQEECAGRGRQRVFDTLSRALMAEREDVSYQALAADLGVGIADVKRGLHRLRQRYRQLLRQQVADTVENPADVDHELRYLVAALAVGRGGG